MPSRSQILIVVSRFPYPLEKGDKLRAYYQIIELSKKFDVILVAVSDHEVAANHIEELEKYCLEVHVKRINIWSKLTGMIRSILNGLPIQCGYFYRRSIKTSIKSIASRKEVKHVYSQLIRTCEYTKDIHSNSKTVDYMDALSAGIKRRIDLQPFYKKWIFKYEAKALVEYERQVFDYFENRTIISDQDKNLILHPENSKIASIPNGIGPSFFEEVERNETFDFVFVGNMSYAPNIEAAHYIVEHLLPSFPDSKLLLAGANPHNSIQKLAERNQAVSITGWVDDIRESYTSGRIFLAPMMIGTGMQNKLLEAMALKTPCITTSLANNAINAKHGIEIHVANSQEEFIQGCQEILKNDSYSSKLAGNAHRFVQEKFDWEHATSELIDIISQSINENISNN